MNEKTKNELNEKLWMNGTKNYEWIGWKNYERTGWKKTMNEQDEKTMNERHEKKPNVHISIILQCSLQAFNTFT